MKFQAFYTALKPERTYANVMTTAAGFLFACRWHIDWLLFIYTILGTTLIVMSACGVNNVTDRRIDAVMARTKKRGTVTGSVPARKLILVAMLFGLIGFAVLAVHVNPLTVIVGAIAYIDYVVLYGWSKRTTPWSTLIGTISGAAPLVAGYTAFTGQFDLTALLLGHVMVFWQMVHFYAIAIFRQKDYTAAQVPVWSVRYGARSTQKWIIFYTLLYLVSVIQLTLFTATGPVFLTVVGLLGLVWVYRGMSGLTSSNPVKWARGMFGYSLINLLVFSLVLPLSVLFN